MTCDFSYHHYKECLVSALSQNYDFFRFCDYENIADSSKFIFLRHDVDHSLDLALKMGVIEHTLGIRATYFIRLHAAKYNALSLVGTQQLYHLKEMGHEIGLHYEPSYSATLKQDPQQSLQVDLNALENCIGEKIISISPHEPTREKSFIVNKELMRKNGLKYQAYDDIFIKQLKYISDSSCNWREGCMHTFIANNIPKLCILTHPFWWYQHSSLENY